MPQINQKLSTGTAKKISLLLLGSFLGLFLIEFGLRISGDIYLRIKGQQDIALAKQTGRYTIVCLGESTTVFYGKDSYPSQLEGILNKSGTGINFKVINKGIVGTTTDVILSYLEDNLNKYNPDMVAAMIGINDSDETIPYRKNRIDKLRLFFRNFRIYKIISRFLKATKHAPVKKPPPPGIPSQAKSRKEISPEIAVSRLADNTAFAAAESYRQKGDWKNAVKLYKKILSEDSENDGSLFGMGEYYRQIEEYPTAVNYFLKSVKSNPDNAVAHISLGFSYFGLNKYQAAIASIEKGLKINPSLKNCLPTLAEIYMACGQYKNARNLLKKIIKDNPDNHYAHLKLINCLVREKKYQGATSLMEGEFKTNPWLDIMHNNLALDYEKCGNLRKADEHRAKAKEVQLARYNPATRHNYNRIKDMVLNRGIKLVCIQYPLRNINALKNLFNQKDNIIFVDNEGVFENALKTNEYRELFKDRFAGDFGHCTPKGNRLLAENIAKSILGEVFKQN